MGTALRAGITHTLLLFPIRPLLIVVGVVSLLVMRQRGRNPLRALITGEDEIGNSAPDWSFAANLACPWNGRRTYPSRFVPCESHLQFSRLKRAT
jgi:hypothetical protein